VIDPLDEVARARGASLYFEGVPVFAAPYFQIPLGERRERRADAELRHQLPIGRRGVGAAVLEYRAQSRPDGDAECELARGLLLQNEFRYLEPNWRGAIEFDTIPHDRVFAVRASTSRRRTNTPMRARDRRLELQPVSDDQFFVDFGHNIVTATQNVCRRRLTWDTTRPTGTARCA